MIQEIEAAVNFLTRLIGKNADPGGSKLTKSNSTSTNNAVFLTDEQIQEFSRKLITVLQTRFRNHWFPERPTRGQAYRCIRINENCSLDTAIATACHDAGIAYDSLHLPVELTLWIDPNEVTCRFGEHKGSYCIVAKLSDGRQENYVNSINIEELEQQSLEHSKQFDMISSSRKKRQIIGHRSKNSAMQQMYVSNSSSTTYHTHHQSMNGSLSNGASPASHLGANSTGHPHVPVTSATQMNGAYVDFGPNGLLPTTSSAAAVSMQQYHSHFSSQQPQPHFYPNSPNGMFQQHHVAVAQHSTHYGSPTNHLFPKFNAMGMQQQSQGPAQQGQLAGNRALNAASLASDYQSMEKDRRHLTTATASATAIVTNRF